MRRFLILVAALVTFTAPLAHAQSEPGKLVCFTQEGLEEVLSHVVNPMQLINNSFGQVIRPQDINRAGCDFSSQPLSDALFGDFYVNDHGLIFPLVEVRNGPRGTYMWAPDGVFRTSGWRISSLCGQGVTTATVGCLVPRSCTVLRGYVNATGGHPPYMGDLSDCRFR